MQRTSIRHRLFVTFLKLAILPLLFAGVILGLYSYQTNLDEAYARQQEVAQRIAVQANSYMEKLQFGLEYAVGYSNFASASDANKHASLLKLIADRERYRELIYFDAEGNEKLHLSNMQMLDEDHQHSVHTPYLTPLRKVYDSERVVRSLIFYDPDNNEPLVLLAIPVHNIRNNKLAGVLVAEVRLKQMWHLIGNLNLVSGEDVYIVGEEGRIVAHHNPSIVLRETMIDLQSERRQQSGLHGNRVLLATSGFTVGQRAFRVVAERDILSALQPAITNISIIIGIVFLALLGIFVIGGRVSYRISQPIIAVSKTAQAIREGDLERQVSETSDDEIGEMARTFNSMTGQLRDSFIELERLNRSYLAIGQCNQAIARADNEMQLLQHICDIVQADCGYRMIWIGLVEHNENKSVRPVAQAGFEQGYLETVNITWAEESVRGRGPTGTAIREQRAVIIADTLNDPSFTPWREHALERGYLSSVSCPIKSGNHVLATLNVYADETNAFSDEEINLLGELSENTCFGMLKLRADAELEEHRDHLEELVNKRTLELSHQKAFSEAVLNNISDGIVACDADGMLSMFNRATREMHGIEQEDLPPEEWAKHYRLYHGDGKTPMEMDDVPLLRAFRGESVKNSELIIERVDGQKLVVFSNGQTMYDDDGNKLGAVVSMHDVTLQRAAEMALIHAKEAAEEANEAKSNFLANMSHELRTPINAILGMLYLALRSNLSPSVKNHLGKAQGAANSLLGVINDILDLSKIEAGRLEIESIEFDLDKVVEQVTDIIAPSAIDKGIEFLIRYDDAIPSLLTGDALRLGQVLINLCSNAVKFTEQGQVELLFYAQSQDESNITIQVCVRDSGIGMSEELQARLFEKFIQADQSTTRRFGGTGLGLAISKNLVEMMGGKIWIESSRLDEGTSLCFTQPLKIVPQTPLNHRVDMERQAMPSLKGLRVLVVDDNSASSEILCEMLRNFHLEVDSESNGLAALSALEAADEHPYDIVLVDWRMPEMNGGEVIRRVRHNLLIQQPKVIMVTAYGLDDIVSQAEQVGVEGFLVKPVSPSALLDTILTAIGRDQLLEKGSAIARRHPHVRHYDFSGSRLLLVEDNEINREFACEFLRSENIVVDEAVDGREAVKMVQQKEYDAILMDIQMPVMDGMEAAQQIRSLAKSTDDERYTTLPIIAMTALAMTDDMEKSRTAGMNDYITKPVDLDLLIELLAKWIPWQECTDKSTDTTEHAVPDDIIPPNLLALTTLKVEEGIHRIGGKLNAYIKQLRRFRRYHSSATAELQRLEEEGDIMQAEAYCHALKGVTGNIGAQALYVKITEIDQNLKQGQFPDATAITEMESLLQEVITDIDSISTMDEQNDEPSDAPLEPAQLNALVERLGQALDFDLMAAESLLNRLQRELQGTPLESTVADIIEKVEVFDTAAATTQVAELKNRLYTDP